ncbi:MAG: alpha/beta hydrolase [Bacteroidetes bacterium]|nr:alpha/beta hydrolase [Bacteroidota bacterium]
MKRPGLLIFIIPVMILFLAGCGGRKYNFPEPKEPGTDGAFNMQEDVFKTGSNEYTADFGTITVPENRNRTGSRFIHIPFIRIHSLSPALLEPIFYLAGGPGQSNLNCIPFDTLLAEHDFVMVGYRGVDGSVKLDCPEVVDALKENDDPLIEESLRNLAKAWEASARRFAQEGIDWNGYTIPQTIEDIEAVRRALKYRQVNLQSESYGTRVAYLYGLMHPESIHRTIMIGVNPPGRCMWDPRMVDQQLHTYARLWSKDSVMSARCPDLIGTMKRVLKNMPDKYLIFSISPGKVKTVAFCLLFHRNTAALVFDAFVQAEQGDYSGLALLSAGYDYTLPSMMTWGELASKAVTADLDTSKIRMYEEYHDSVLGSPLNTILWNPMLYTQMPLQLIPEELRILRESDVETLLLSGSLDFSDPPQYASQDLLPYLRNGKQVILSEFGHVNDLLYLRKKSTEKLLASYFNTGIPDTSGIEYVPMDFNVKWGLSSITKTVVVTGITIAVGLIAGLIWILRKVL